MMEPWVMVKPKSYDLSTLTMQDVWIPKSLFLDMFGTTISWKVSLQKFVALSTTEAKYIAIIEAMKEALWLEGIVKEPELQGQAVTVKYDSQSVIHMLKNSAYHERRKNIDVRLHFAREKIESGEVKVVKVSIDHNDAYMITKSFPSSKVFHCM